MKEEQKPKFKPVITRVKLNPEQAVLQCSCYGIGWAGGAGPPGSGCEVNTKNMLTTRSGTSAAAS